MALAAYETEVAALRDPSDDDLMAAVDRVVLALNDIDEVHGCIETDERYELCQFIEDVLTHKGFDVRALCARRGLALDELPAGRTW